MTDTAPAPEGELERLLEDLERLEKAATPAPWVVRPCGVQRECWCRVILGPYQEAIMGEGGIDTENAERYTALRNALPTLLAAVRRLRAADERNRAALANIRKLVDTQAEDAGLWFLTATAPEAYLQQQLRVLHAVIEGAMGDLVEAALGEGG